MDGDDDDVIRLTQARNLLRNTGDACLGKVGQEVDACGVFRSRPIARDAARLRRERKDKNTAFATDVEDCWGAGMPEISARPCGPDPQPLQDR